MLFYYQLMLDYSLVHTEHTKQCTNYAGFKILQLPVQPFPLVRMQIHVEDLLPEVWKSLSLTPCVELLLKLVRILYLQEYM